MAAPALRPRAIVCDHLAVWFGPLDVAYIVGRQGLDVVDPSSFFDPDHSHDLEDVGAEDSAPAAVRSVGFAVNSSSTRSAELLSVPASAVSRWIESDIRLACVGAGSSVRLEESLALVVCFWRAALVLADVERANFFIDCRSEDRQHRGSASTIHNCCSQVPPFCPAERSQ